MVYVIVLAVSIFLLVCSVGIITACSLGKKCDEDMDKMFKLKYGENEDGQE